MTATDTRKKAREALAGKWGKGALITLFFAIFSSILTTISGKLEQESAISFIFNLIIAIIQVPISYGFIISFIKIKRGEEVGYFDFLKDGFNNFSRAWGIIGNTILKMIVPIILIVVSVIIMGATIGFSAVSILSEGSSSSLPALAIIGILIYTASLVYAFVRGLLYSVSNYIAYDNPEMSTKDAVEESAKLMNGKRGSFFVLELSFIGWALLAAFTFGIGAFWLIPYMQVAIICFYEQISNKDESSQEVISSSKE